MGVRASAVRQVPGRWVAVAVGIGILVGYTLAVDPVVRSPQQVVYPFIWIGCSLTALWLVRDRLGVSPLSLSVGAAYTLVLLWTAGLLGPPHGVTGVSVHLGLPGWSPTVVYSGSVVSLTVVPFLAVGYVTLGVLAANALRATLETTAAGVLGLFACVSCTAPLFAGIAGSLGAGSVAATLSTAQYPLATAAFLLSAGSLVVLTRRTP